MIGCFWMLLALFGSLDLKKTLGIDRFIVGGVVAVSAYLPRDGLARPRSPPEASADRARASRRTLRMTY
jgi:hypothetical protein